MESLIKAHPKANLKPQVVAETDHFRWSVDKDAVLAPVRAGLMQLGLLGLETGFMIGKTAWEYRKLLFSLLAAGVLAGAVMKAHESGMDNDTKPSKQYVPPKPVVENSPKEEVVTVKKGDTLWALVGNFLGTKDPQELDAIKDRLFTEYGDRIHHLRVGEIITIQSVSGKIRVVFEERNKLPR